MRPTQRPHGQTWAPRRVLMVSSLFPPRHEGGYELVCESTAEVLARRGSLVSVVTTGDERWGAAPAGPEGGPSVLASLRPLPDSPVGRLAATLRNASILWREIRRFRPDWICSWSLALVGPLPLVPALAARIPVTMAILDYRLRDLLAAPLLARPAADPAEPVVTLAERIGARILRARRFGVTFVVPSRHLRERYSHVGLGPQRLGTFSEPCRAAIPNAPFPARRSQDVLYTGRLVEGKGILDLVRAFALAVGEDHETGGRLIVLGRGDPEFEQRILETAEHLGVGDRMDLRGMVDLQEVIRSMDAAGVLVVPSLWEDPAPLTILEGQARGCPVVAYAAGGIPEHVEHDKSGILVDRGDVEGLAAAILRVLRDRALAARLATCAIRSVKQAHDPDVALETLLSTAAMLAGAGPNGGRPRPASR